MHVLDTICPDKKDEAVLLEHSKYYDDLSFKHIMQQNGKKYTIIKFKMSDY